MDMNDWEDSLEALENALNYTFTDIGKLKTALTHSSFVNENNDDLEHNERLEFLGDAVLELCVSQELFRRFNQEREGKLTKMRAQMVSRGALEARARELAAVPLKAKNTSQSVSNRLRKYSEARSVH